MKNTMRLSLLVAGVLGICNGVFSQSVEQGKKFLYYQRYKSAKDVFDKLLAANPNNIEAIYWEGQTLLDMKDSVAAGELYSKALQSNGSAPLILVGMGNVELRQGKATDAKQRFETAISLSKGKDIDVLNAVADANIDAHSGDATYAIEKLNQATQQKKFNSAETYVLMGDAYRKLINGGDAVQSYQKALAIDPKYAEAKYKIGKIYLTQNNREYFLPAFEEAVEMDPAYAPAYFELFYYWYYHDVNKAADYLDKYIANSDPGPDVEYLKTDYLYQTGKFADAKTKALGLISSLNDKVAPRMYKMVAYVNDTLNDLPGAKQYMTTYFSKQDTAAIIGGDYAELAHIDSKSTDTATMLQAVEEYKKAIARDTVPEFKAKYLASAMELVKRLKNRQGIADLSAIYYASKKEPSQTDLYNWGMANYQAGNYKTADSIFCGIYETRFPTEIYGYLWCARAMQMQDDSLNSQGLAVGAYDKLAAFSRTFDSTAHAAGSADSTKYKGQAISSYFFLAGYYNDVKKDKQTAILYLQKLLEIDPTNANAQRIIGLLNKPARQAKPATGATGTGSGGATGAAGAAKPKTTGK